MTLHAAVRLRRSAFELDVAFDVPGGQVVAVLGPNGSGKSTLLDCLAGLLRPAGTSVSIGGRPLDALPPHERRVGVLRQDPLLFPHLSALENVAFGRRARGAHRARARKEAGRWLAEVGADELAERKPAQLSGGQAQRVAIARALATEPDLLLLDEPLAALDVHAAPAIRALLRRTLRSRVGDRVTVLVTHDPLDALALADSVLVLADGRVVERGPTQEVLAVPRTPFTARIAGVNLVAGHARTDGLRAADGLVSGLLAADAVDGEPAVAVFAPSTVSVFARGEAPRHGSPRNTADATVETLEPHGAVVRLRTAQAPEWAGGIAADLTPAAVAELAIEPGSAITVSVKATSVRIHPAAPPARP